jgi:hypothetical protein
MQRTATNAVFPVRRRMILVSLILAAFAAPTLSQIPSEMPDPPPDQNVYGTYNVQTNGDSGPVTDSSDQNSKTVRQEWETSSWQLNFYKKGTANYVTTHLLAWTHELDYTQTFYSGTTGKIVTATKTEKFSDEPDVTATLTIQFFNLNGKVYRKLAMSQSEPTAGVKTTMTITRYDRSGKVIEPVDVRPAPGVPFKADLLRMHLDLPNWPTAQWSNGYTGSITAQNNYKDYITPVTNNHWLTVKGQWNLHP